MKRWIAWLLCFLLSVNAFADSEENVGDSDELDENARLEFDYSFMEGVKSRITGNLQESGEWFNKCLKIQPSSPVVRYELASLFLMNDDLETALKYAREAVEGNPDNIWYKVLLGDILYRGSMIEEACNVYDKIISEYPDKEEFYFIEGTLLTSIEKLREAIEVYDRHERQYGIVESFSIEKARLYEKLGDVEKAGEELLKLVRKFPDKNEYIGFLAGLYFNCNEDKKGLRILESLLRENPNNGYVIFHLADYYRGKKKFGLAEEYTMKALANDKIDTNLKLEYIFTLSSDTSGISLEKLDSYMYFMMERYDDDLSVRLLHQDFSLRYGRFDDAKTDFEYILSRNKYMYEEWEGLLLLCERMSDTLGLYSNSIEAVKYFPEEPLPYLSAGISMMMMNRYPEAIDFFKNGVLISNLETAYKVQYFSSMAECYYNIDSVQQAFSLFDEVLKLSPNDIYVLNNYAYYLSLRGENLSKAEYMSSKAVKMEPDNSTYLDTYAWVLYKREDYSLAKFYIKLAIEKSSEPSYVLYEHYGHILLALGEKDEAIKMFSKAVELNPSVAEQLRDIFEKSDAL